MKIDVSDEEVKLVVEALEHLYAYTRAAQREIAENVQMAGALPPDICHYRKRRFGADVAPAIHLYGLTTSRAIAGGRLTSRE
jgi:hypothetical protein